MTDTQEAMREEFEAMMITHFLPIAKFEDSAYQHYTVQIAWKCLIEHTAQSAEKIARLEQHVKDLQNIIEEENKDHIEQLAAAELSNKQLRDVLEDFARGQLQVPNFEAYVSATAKTALAQQPSTAALDAYVASKAPVLKIPGAQVRKDYSYIGDDKFTPEIIITFPACSADDSASWNDRDNIVRMFNTEPLPPAPEKE